MRGLWNLASLQELINVKCGLCCTWSWETPTGVGKIVYSFGGYAAFKTHFRKPISEFFQMTSLQNACPDRDGLNAVGHSQVWQEEDALRSQTHVRSDVSSISTDRVTLGKPTPDPLSQPGWGCSSVTKSFGIEAGEQSDIVAMSLPMTGRHRFSSF